jgi:hypothetical protein
MSDNKIKTTWNIVKIETGKIHLQEQMPSHLINGEKVKDPGRVAYAVNNFFLTITENRNLHQAGKEGAISLLKNSLPNKILVIKLIPTTEAEMKSIIHFLK